MRIYTVAGALSRTLQLWGTCTLPLRVANRESRAASGKISYVPLARKSGNCAFLVFEREGWGGEGEWSRRLSYISSAFRRVSNNVLIRSRRDGSSRREIWLDNRRAFARREHYPKRISFRFIRRIPLSHCRDNSPDIIFRCNLYQRYFT